MDLQKIASTLLSADAVEGLSKRSGASASDVKSVLTQALPALLGGVDEQAKGADTADGFSAALSDHAKNSTLDLSGFLGNVDLEDGAKIIGHLLGGNTSDTTKSVAKKAGVSNKKTSSILSAAAPLLMSLLGQQADEDDKKDSGVGSLIGSLLSNVDVGELLSGLLTDQDTTKKKKSTKKTSANKTTAKKSTKKTTTKKTSTKKKSSSKKADDSSSLGSIVGGFLKGLLK